MNHSTQFFIALVFALCVYTNAHNYHYRDANKGDDSVYVFNMSGNINVIQSYYLPVVIGNPPQLVNLLVDTGSSDLIVPSSNCTTCSPTHTYNSELSTSGVTSMPCDAFPTCPFCFLGMCGVGDAYGGGMTSATGFVGSDLVQLVSNSTNLPAVQSVINIVYYESVQDGAGPFFPAPIDGILGLSYPANSATNSNTFFDNLVQQKIIKQDVFSHYLTNDGGVLVLGGVDSRYFTGPIQYTPFVQENFYAINTTDIQVNGKSLGISWQIYNQDDTIVDCGTAQFIIPMQAYNSMKQLFLAECKYNPKIHGVCDVPSDQTIFDNVCFDLSPAQIAVYPELTVVFNPNVSLPLQANYYLLPSATQSGYYCLGIIAMDGYTGTAIGDVFLQAYYSVYDRQNSRMGFAAISQIN